MPVIFNPSGQLDVSTDPADLPMQIEGKVALSGAMTRCTNLHLDRKGIASTRRGSAKLNSSAMAQTHINRIIEQGGTRYCFNGTSIYKNEGNIAANLTDAEWSAVLYNPYSSETQEVYALNGTDRKIIDGNNIREWGVDGPIAAIVINPSFYTNRSWESNSIANSRKFTQTEGDYDVIFDWEVSFLQHDISDLYGTAFYTRIWESGELANAKQFGLELTTYTVLYDWEVTHLGLTGTVPGISTKFMWIFEYPPDNPVVTDTDTYKNQYPFELGIVADLVAASDYQVKYTWARKAASILEFESNPSTAAVFTTDLATEPVGVYWDAPTDSQITHVRVYRTLAAGTRYYFDEEFLVGVGKGLLTKNDADLGTECDWVNHDRPPLGTKVLGPNFGGICFIIKDNLLYFCLTNQPEYWPEAYYVEVSPKQFPLKAGTFLDGQLFVATTDEIYSIQGSGAQSFFPLPMSAITGTISPNVFKAIKGFGILHLGNDGLYQYTGGKDQKISYAFEPVFWGEAKGSIPGINRTFMQNCILEAFNSKFYFGFPGGASEYPDNFLVWDLKNDQVQHYQYASDIRTLAVDHHNKRLLAGDTLGFIWEIEKKAAATDHGTIISWDLQGAEYNHLRKYFPRYARYDVVLGAGATATATILLDDIVKQTHNLNGSRLTKKRLVDGCTGDRLSMRINGTGQVDIYGIEIE